jgi:hypothetical protein
MIRALVLGGAASVYDDARAAQEIASEAGVTFDLVLAANAIAVHWPTRITHLISLHPEKLAAWQAARRERGGNDDYLTVTTARPNVRLMPRVDRVSRDWGGSSGLFGVKVALEEMADVIVLAGVPMTRSPHFDSDAPWRDRDSFVNAWKRWRKHYAANTRSMSGYTQSLLGAPDVAFMTGAGRQPAMTDSRCETGRGA